MSIKSIKIMSIKSIKKTNLLCQGYTIMRFPRIVFQALKDSACLYKYVLVQLIIVALDFCQQTMMAKILTGDSGDDFRKVLAGIILIIPVVRFGLFGKLIAKICAGVQTSFWKVNLEEYSFLTTESKHSFPIKEMRRKVQDTQWGLSYWVESGFPIILNIASMAYLCIYTFVYSQSLVLFIGLVIGNVTLYFSIKKKLDKRMSNIFEEMEGKYDKIEQKLTLNLPRFAHGSKDLNFIMELISEFTSIRSRFNTSRSEQKIFTGVLNQICVAIILIIIPSNSLVNLITVTLQFTNTVNNVFNLLNTNVHFEDKYTSLRKNFDKANKKSFEPEQFVLEHTLVVNDYQVSKEDFSLKMNRPLPLSIGNKILIRGASGAGKSTFLKGILGLDESAKVSLSNGKTPKNYFKNISLMYQSIKEDLQFNNLTLREIFDDSTDEKLIEEVSN